MRRKGVTDADVGRYVKDEEGDGMRQRRLVVRDGAFRGQSK